MVSHRDSTNMAAALVESNSRWPAGITDIHASFDRTGEEMKLIYLSHAFGGDIAKADNAEKWCAFLTWNIKGAFFCAPWVHMVKSRLIAETRENFMRGLALDVESIRCYAGVCAVLDDSLGRLSKGQSMEYDAAEFPRRFLIPFSIVPTPEHPVVSAVQAWVESLP